jgi:hypothetical protein
MAAYERGWSRFEGTLNPDWGTNGIKLDGCPVLDREARNLSAEKSGAAQHLSAHIR